MLIEFNITPIIVFDGSNISAKQRILDERTKNRMNSREKSMHLLLEGRADEANKKFGQSFTITPYLIQRILKVIKGNWWKYVIAPYEADPQLAYLYKTGKVDVVFTEDSDLIAYGVNKLLYKMDNAGDGYELDMMLLYKDTQSNSDKIRTAQNLTENIFQKVINMNEEADPIWIDCDAADSLEGNALWLNAWDSSTVSASKIDPLFQRDKFLSMWILAGWDYIEPIKGIGFKTAYKLIEEHGWIENIIKTVLNSSKYTVPKDYITQFHKAYLTFLFQVVFDPDTKKLTYLSEPKIDDNYGKLLIDMEDKTFLGDLNRTDDSQILSEDTFEYILSQKNTIEPLRLDQNIQNNWVENDENSGDSSCKDLSSSESKSVMKK